MGLDEYIGLTVVDDAGKEIGTVAAVVAASDDARPGWIELSTKMYPSHHPLVPMASAVVSAGHIAVIYSRGQVNNSPAVSDRHDLSESELARLRAYYNLPAGSGTPIAPASSADKEAAVTVSEELLTVETAWHAAERVTISKYFVTETVTQTFELTREEIRVEHHPLEAPTTASDSTSPYTAPHPLVLILHAERLTVGKEVVPVERVLITTVRVDGTHEIDESVRREQVHVTAPDGSSIQTGS